MTSQLIKQLFASLDTKTYIQTKPEVHALFEIAYQLAVMNERNVELDKMNTITLKKTSGYEGNI